jgi:predicted DsbA family dithiol-disulfide isomerase
MKIEVLAGCCTTDTTLLDAVHAAVRATGVKAEVIKVEEDMASIMQYGVMNTPALVIDGRVVCCGTSPTPAEIQKYL